MNRLFSKLLSVFKGGREGSSEGSLLDETSVLLLEVDDKSVALKEAGNVHFGKGELEEAACCYQQAIDITPNYADVYNNLGLVFKFQRKYEAAEKALRRAIEINPTLANAHFNIALIAYEQGNIVGAKEALGVGVKRSPAYVHFHLLLAEILLEENELQEASNSFRQVLIFESNNYRALSALAMLSLKQGKFQLAVSQYANLIVMQPQDAEAHNNLGVALQYCFEHQKSMSSCRRAIAIKPDYADAHFNLGNALRSLGKIEDALSEFEQAMELDPEGFATHTALLFCQNYHSTRSGEDIFREYRQWNTKFAAGFLNSILPFKNYVEHQRRLRIGYVSADFCQHSVAFFAAPLLECHDLSQVEVFCYFNSYQSDHVTEHFRATANHWRPCAHMTDEQLAQSIRDDQIDILIDLSGHTAGNRLLVFARKPAPVQISWMGFGYTTGLTAMDYFIGDKVFTPVGSDHLFSEKIYRLPHSFVSYQPPSYAPDPGPLPARDNGYVTFACLSRAERINKRVIAAWAVILQRLPTAHLRLDSRSFSSSHLCKEVQDEFSARGIAAERLELGFSAPVWDVYRQVDVILDCFPHNSGTTTCEALWMGVPVVTLADRPSVGRLGAAYLAAIGKQEWIADNVDNYIALAVEIGSDPAALAKHRSELRRMMTASPLLDHQGFARDMETAYRDMWCQWCDSVALES
jgi:predicted O-linked N-acetylglucosamine transferase (SPINDLY family)